MTNLYVFWRKVADPPSPWTRLTRTNQYLRFNGTPGNHWTRTGATTHTHPSASINVGNSVHGGEMVTRLTPTNNDSIMGMHNHPVAGYSIENSNNNNPPGWGLDIIYMDLATWESSVRSFPEGTIIMSNGVLTDASLERYSSADGKYIVHTTPETTVGTTTPQNHTVSGSLSEVQGVVFSDGSFAQQLVGDRALHHSHTFSFASEAKYVEPRNLVTRLYHALQNTSRAVAGSVVFVDGSVSANWEILTGWAGGNLKAGNSDPTLSGSDTHEQSLSGNSSTYNGPNAFSDLHYDRCWDYHYHPIAGSLAAASHVPLSRYIVPARLLNTIRKITFYNNTPQIIGL